MSGIIGTFHRNGAPADGDASRRMLDAIAYRGTEASRVWLDGPMALGHCLFATTPESVGESQPYCLRDAGLCIVFDGRLDNRRELQESFDRARVEPGADCDAAFALCAYRLWDIECASRLLGDFACAIWDAPRQRLFCARDVMGIKPFYFHCGPDLFLLASEPQALLAHPRVSRRPNEAMIGEYLSVVTSTAETLFAEIQRLPPAGRLVVSAAAVKVDTYWTIDTAREIRYSTTAEYCEHLDGLLRDAVRARLRTSGGAGVMLSGGVDSSSLFGIAASLNTRGEIAAPCGAWSLVGEGDVMDETPFIAQVAARHGHRPQMFANDTVTADDLRALARQRADVPPPPCGLLARTLKTQARDAGVRVLLTGFWGDEWFSGSYYHCTDLWRTGRWMALARTARAHKRDPRLEKPGPLVKYLTWPLLSRRLRRRIKMLIGRDGVPPWVSAAFARRIALADRLYPDDRAPAFPTVAQQEIFRESLSGVSVLATEDEDRVNAAAGIESRHPFADRRVMEFGMAIPEDLRRRNGVKKFVLREAMRQYLPDEIRDRVTSADSSSMFLRSIDELVRDGLLDRSTMADRGWIDRARTQRMYDGVAARYRAKDATYARDVWPLWTLVAVEVWMREVIEGRN